MARAALSEFQAKSLVSDALGYAYEGHTLHSSNFSDQLQQIQSAANSFVLKVDQGIKGRFKKGLVLLDVSYDDLEASAMQLFKKGFNTLLVEPMRAYQAHQERYLSLQRQRDGILLTANEHGGIDVEKFQSQNKKVLIKDTRRVDQLGLVLGFSPEKIKTLLRLMDESHFTMIEINPYIVIDNALIPLDIAVEVDKAGQYFTSKWKDEHTCAFNSTKGSEEERRVHDLSAKSSSSFKLELLNPNGSIFLLLSGGGASIVIADEIHNLGYGEQIANYGEYSGNPTAEETQLYTSAVLDLLLKSTAKKKVLFIGGAIANFTDIANTFTGIINALQVVSSQLKEQNIKVYVRRGGPREEVGLKKIESALEELGILGAVYNAQVSLPVAIDKTLKGLQ